MSNGQSAAKFRIGKSSTTIEKYLNMEVSRVIINLDNINYETVGIVLRKCYGYKFSKL